MAMRKHTAPTTQRVVSFGRPETKFVTAPIWVSLTPSHPGQPAEPVRCPWHQRWSLVHHGQQGLTARLPQTLDPIF
jgi:hypothetical protein